MNIDKRSDRALISAYKEGDERAISTIIERHRRKIYNYIYLLVKDRDIADDIFQDLFIKVINSLRADKYNDNGKFMSWVLRIAHNLVIDHFRSVKTKGAVSADSTMVLNDKKLSDSSVEDKMITSQNESDIRKLVDHLPIEQREVVIMRHYMNMSFKEIADHTDVSINTALGRMRYALINLRKMIEDYNLTFKLS